MKSRGASSAAAVCGGGESRGDYILEVGSLICTRVVEWGRCNVVWH